MQQSYLDVMPKTIECLEKNIGEKLCDIHVGEGFFGITHTHTHTQAIAYSPLHYLWFLLTFQTLNFDTFCEKQYSLHWAKFSYFFFILTFYLQFFSESHYLEVM